MWYEVTHMNDCCDENARMRLEMFACRLFPKGRTRVRFVGLTSRRPDLEAGGQLIDAFEAADAEMALPEPGGEETLNIFIVNSAWRGGPAVRRNGGHFYFWQYNRNRVFTTDGFAITFPAKLGLLQEYTEIDVPAVLEAKLKEGAISEGDRGMLLDTQFRSLYLLTRMAYWYRDPETKVPGIEHIPEKTMPWLVWYKDRFGNCKTTWTADQADWTEGQELEFHTPYGTRSVRCYAGINGIPDGQPGWVPGSSGYGTEGLELIVRGGSAAERFGLEVGSEL